jgi:Cu(I)/Ag(I) efflux system membrane fusion protein
MKRSVLIAIVAAVIAAAAAGVIWRPFVSSSGDTKHAHVMEQARAEPAAAAIYYQDPDGKPFYSLTPKKTPDGRDYRAVPAGADVSFDDPADVAAAPPADRKIKYYRNPMGLPDVSTTPKKDSMGMDYIPVYEGNDSEEGSVKLSPGRIQRSGVKSEPATMRVIRTTIRAPGTVQLDERRVSVIAMRSESYVQKVADVTTGAHVAPRSPPRRPNTSRRSTRRLLAATQPTARARASG